MRGLLAVGLIAKVFDVLLLGFTSRKSSVISKQVQAPHPSAALRETAAATFPQGKAGCLSGPKCTVFSLQEFSEVP